MTLEENIKIANKKIEEVTKLQKKHNEKINNMKEEKLDIIKKEIVDKIDNNNSQKIIDLVSKFNKIIYGKSSINELNNDATKVMKICFDTWVSKKFETPYPMKNEYLISRDYYNARNKNIIVNRRGFGYNYGWGNITRYITNPADIREILVNEKRLKNYIFKKDRKQIYEIFMRYLPKIKFQVEDNAKISINGLDIKLLDIDDDNKYYGIEKVKYINKNSLKIRKNWREWEFRIFNDTRYDYSEKVVSLKNEISKEGALILSQIPNRAILSIENHINNLDKINKKNWKYYKKMRSELEPYLFAYEI